MTIDGVMSRMTKNTGEKQAAGLPKGRRMWYDRRKPPFRGKAWNGNHTTKEEGRVIYGSIAA